MKFFPAFLKALAAGAAAGAVILVQQLVAFFQGVPPSDVGMVVWGVIGTVAVLVFNLLVGKLPPAR